MAKTPEKNTDLDGLFAARLVRSNTYTLIVPAHMKQEDPRCKDSYLWTRTDVPDSDWILVPGIVADHLDDHAFDNVNVVEGEVTTSEPRDKFQIIPAEEATIVPRPEDPVPGRRARSERAAKSPAAKPRAPRSRSRQQPAT